MDSQKFGNFISNLRKEKGWTQRELAKKLHVTDKAISRWERGIGYPDIQSIEPLAEALGVSIMEIMRSEKMEEKDISQATAAEAIDNVIDIAHYQSKIARRNTLIAVISFVAVVSLTFLIDNVPIEIVLIGILPFLFFGVSVILFVISFVRWLKDRSYIRTLLLGLLAMAYPVGIFILFLMYFPHPT